MGLEMTDCCKVNALSVVWNNFSNSLRDCCTSQDLMHKNDVSLTEAMIRSLVSIPQLNTSLRSWCSFDEEFVCALTYVLHLCTPLTPSPTNGSSCFGYDRLPCVVLDMIPRRSDRVVRVDSFKMFSSRESDASCLGSDVLVDGSFVLSGLLQRMYTRAARQIHYRSRSECEKALDSCESVLADSFVDFTPDMWRVRLWVATVVQTLSRLSATQKCRNRSCYRKTFECESCDLVCEKVGRDKEDVLTLSSTIARATKLPHGRYICALLGCDSSVHSSSWHSGCGCFCSRRCWMEWQEDVHRDRVCETAFELMSFNRKRRWSEASCCDMVSVVHDRLSSALARNQVFDVRSMKKTSSGSKLRHAHWRDVARARSHAIRVLNSDVLLLFAASQLSTLSCAREMMSRIRFGDWNWRSSLPCSVLRSLSRWSRTTSVLYDESVLLRVHGCSLQQVRYASSNPFEMVKNAFFDDATDFES